MFMAACYVLFGREPITLLLNVTGATGTYVLNCQGLDTCADMEYSSILTIQDSVKKSRIRETKNLSTDADSSTDTIFPLFFIRSFQIMDEFS